MWTLGQKGVVLFFCPYLLQPALELTGRKIMPTSHVRKYANIPSNATVSLVLAFGKFALVDSVFLLNKELQNNGFQHSH